MITAGTHIPDSMLLVVKVPLHFIWLIECGCILISEKKKPVVCHSAAEGHNTLQATYQFLIKKHPLVMSSKERINLYWIIHFWESLNFLNAPLCRCEDDLGQCEGWLGWMWRMTRVGVRDDLGQCDWWLRWVWGMTWVSTCEGWLWVMTIIIEVVCAHSPWPESRNIDFHL